MIAAENGDFILGYAADQHCGRCGHLTKCRFEGKISTSSLMGYRNSSEIYRMVSICLMCKYAESISGLGHDELIAKLETGKELTRSHYRSYFLTGTESAERYLQVLNDLGLHDLVIYVTDTLVDIEYL